jgi:hypothetical protein
MPIVGYFTDTLRIRTPFNPPLNPRQNLKPKSSAIEVSVTLLFVVVFGSGEQWNFTEQTARSLASGQTI